MADLIARMAARTLGLMPVLQPRIASMFESGLSGVGMARSDQLGGSSSEESRSESPVADSELLAATNAATDAVAPAVAQPKPLVKTDRPTLEISRVPRSNTLPPQAVRSVEQNFGEPGLLPVVEPEAAPDRAISSSVELDGNSSEFSAVSPQSSVNLTPFSTDDGIISIERSLASEVNPLSTSASIPEQHSLQPIVNPVSPQIQQLSNLQPPTDSLPSPVLSPGSTTSSNPIASSPLRELKTPTDSLPSQASPLSSTQSLHPTVSPNPTTSAHGTAAQKFPNSEITDVIQPLVQPASDRPVANQQTPSLADAPSSVSPRLTEPSQLPSVQSIDNLTEIHPRPSTSNLTSRSTEANRPIEPARAILPLIPQPEVKPNLAQLGTSLAAQQPTWPDRPGITPTITTSPPTIRVSIGRIEVRAVTTPAPARSRPASAKPRLSLNDYLNARSGGDR